MAPRPACLGTKPSYLGLGRSSLPLSFRASDAFVVPAAVTRLRSQRFARMASSSTSTPPPATARSRNIHNSSTNRNTAAPVAATATLLDGSEAAAADVLPATPHPPPAADKMLLRRPPPPLSVLPLTAVLRSWAVTTISSSPILLGPSLAAMSVLAHATSPLLNPDRNFLLRAFLKKTFYAQFCAGETPREVRATIAGLKNIGFTGVILGYAREVVLSEAQTKDLASCGEGEAAEECIRNEIIPWAEGTLETVRLASPGDFVALKFTGAGRQALYHLSAQLPPSPALAKAIDEICDLASERGVRLLFDAEQQAVQAGIDDWTVAYMRRYNRAGRAVVYGTYQAYLKATPRILGSHLRVASEEGFTLGVKLVRGAYLGSDPRHLIHDTKGDTDAAYDGIVAALLTREWSGPFSTHSSSEAKFPDVDMVLASHNAESVRKGRAIVESRRARTREVAFAQLQGMADEVSCELVSTTEEKEKEHKLRSYKYIVWGSTGECMKYLLRRAQENRDAVQRTRSGREAMAGEIRRRVRGYFGLV